MSASNTDKFKKLTNNFSTTLSSAIVGAGDSSMSLASTTNLPTGTGIVLVIDRVNSSGTATPSSREYVIGTVSGGNVTNLLRGQGNSTAQAHSIGAVVEQVVDQTTINDIIDGILKDHDQQGRHVQITDTNGSIIIGLTPTGSSANQLYVGNAATGGNPSLLPSGSDSNVGLSIIPKGLGGLDLQGRYDAWTKLYASLTYAGNNGQKEFLVNTSFDISSFITPGMKLRFDRGTTPPTQCMAFVAASSQYGTKSSPGGMTDTSTFTAEAWVYLNSYTAGGIISRDSGGASGGWTLAVTSSGQLTLIWRNASGASQFTSFQSLPLKRWVHVAGAATNIGTPAASLYMNGASLAVQTGSSAATTRLQSGSLQVGAFNTSNFFDGYISEARYWSTAQSQGNIQANMTVSLTGSESNLVALFQGNGNFNDKTSNANNLTATNSAIATQAANPYNSTEYGVITKVTSSQLTVFTGTDYMVPNMTLNNPYYSTARNPNGGNWQRTHWIVDNIHQASASKSTATSGTWQNTGTNTGDFGQISLPGGEWDVYMQTALFASSTTSGPVSAQATLSSSNSSASNPEFNHDVAARATVATNVVADGTQTARAPLSLSAQTTYYRNLRTNDSNNSNIILNTYSGQYSVIRAELAYV